MPKNYYITLGISRGADLNQIKKAYRRIAKKYHPDTTQSPDSRQFRKIKEAYETLAHEDTRKKYDAALEHQSVPVKRSSTAEKIKRQSAFFDEMIRFESSLDEFFGGFVPGWFHKERFRPVEKNLYYEVILSPQEAWHGGLFPIRVPVVELCPQCGDTEFWDGLACPECNGRGYRHTQRGFSLSIPPHTRHGTEATVSLEDIGLPDANLFVRVHIDPAL